MTEIFYDSLLMDSCDRLRDHATRVAELRGPRDRNDHVIGQEVFWDDIQGNDEMQSERRDESVTPGQSRENAHSALDS